MSESKSFQVLKNAILLEKKGRAFYTKVAEDAKDDAVKDFFQSMADQETLHLKHLSEQYSLYQEKQCFGKRQYPLNEESFPVSEVITKKFVDAVDAAGFEAAAISAAMIMEKNAIDLYSKRAEETDDPEEKALYTWLCEWEKGHLSFLSEIDRLLTEDIWFSNHFWPQ